MRDTAAFYYPANRVIYAADSAARASVLREHETKPPFLAAAFTHNPIDGSLYATYLREQGRLGAAAGEREAAIAAYRRYLRLRSNAEPVLSRDLATVRTELEKRERQSSGR